MKTTYIVSSSEYINGDHALIFEKFTSRDEALLFIESLENRIKEVVLYQDWSAEEIEKYKNGEGETLSDFSLEIELKEVGENDEVFSVETIKLKSEKELFEENL